MATFTNIMALIVLCNIGQQKGAAANDLKCYKCGITIVMPWNPQSQSTVDEIQNSGNMGQCNDPFNSHRPKDVTTLETTCSGDQDRCAKLERRIDNYNNGQKIVLGRGCVKKSWCDNGNDWSGVKGAKLSCCDGGKCNSTPMTKGSLRLLLIPMVVLMMIRARA